MINAGQLNKRISLVKLVEGGTDSSGYPTEPIIKEFKVWAMVKSISAREFFEAKATQSEDIKRFIIRYRKDIDSDMDIVYKGETYEIVAPPINDNEENITLTLMARVVR